MENINWSTVAEVMQLNVSGICTIKKVVEVKPKHGIEIRYYSGEIKQIFFLDRVNRNIAYNVLKAKLNHLAVIEETAGAI